VHPQRCLRGPLILVAWLNGRGRRIRGSTEMVTWSGECVACGADSERGRRRRCLGRCAWRWTQVPAPTVLPERTGDPVRGAAEPA
jgi:hypothetical protein